MFLKTLKDLRHPLYCRVLFFVSLLIHTCHSTEIVLPVEYPTANLSTTWINTPSPVRGSSALVSPILLKGTNGTRFVFGFYCDPDPRLCLLSILIFENRLGSGSNSIDSPKPVWSARRDSFVKVNSTLEITYHRGLVLNNSNGDLVWSTNTSGGLSLNLTEQGNLVLLGKDNLALWQSFDHPTDCLVPGQGLSHGQKLISSVSSSWSTYSFSLEVKNTQLLGYVNANPPQYYYQLRLDYRGASIGPVLATDSGDGLLFVPQARPTSQFAKLDFDGYFRVYMWMGSKWGQKADLLTEYTGECGYPMSCLMYGICSGDGPTTGPCTCPNETNFKINYFKKSSSDQPDQGCIPITPVSCELKKDHRLLEISEQQYFFFNTDIGNVDIESCKQACLSNCSCRAAIFRQGSNNLKGDCFLPNELFSLMTRQKYNVTISDGGRTKSSITAYSSSTDGTRPISTFLKVQIPSSARNRRKNNLVVILVSNVAGIVGLILIVGVGIFILQRNKENEEPEEEVIDEVEGILNRFSYEDLKSITDNFAKKLGQGGNGSVYEGCLVNGTVVAVKQLDDLGHVKQSFLAEVETIGNTNHANLVRLIGYCAEKSRKLLVYEYMCNSSLDKWIFQKVKVASLPWPLRRRIISGIAKGLAYLHEECRQKILHLDIKPQNILLDENFEAKVSDFGLSKLMDNGQSQVVTRMRGTPGYLAPEWLSSTITEKVDVYSFGVMVLEMLCGRKNFDRSLPEEDMHLLTVYERKAEEEQLLDIVDKYCKNVHLYETEIMQMLSIAAWCLQGDHTKRPAMSTVVKVLEGLMEVETNLNWCFSNYSVHRRTVIADVNSRANIEDVTPLLPSLLSGPR